MADAFSRALALTLRYEGGFVHDPDDPGGATNKGITQATYDRWRRAQRMPLRHVREITDEEVAAIYRSEYWTAARCPDLPDPVAIAHFDAAVNCGVATAARMLQRAVGVADDGVIGPATLAAVRTQEPDRVVDAMLFERLRYYLQISLRQRPDGRNLGKFLPGWLSRVLQLREALR